MTVRPVPTLQWPVASDASARLRFHTQTGGVTLQAQQPLNNVVRVTVQALAAVLGDQPLGERQRIVAAAGEAEEEVHRATGGGDDSLRDDECGHEPDDVGDGPAQGRQAGCSRSACA